MILLTRHALPSYVPPTLNARQQTWPLKIVATAEAGNTTLSPKIFIYHARDREVASVDDLFEVVASVHQMEFPEDKPSLDVDDASRCIPYYRSDTLTFHCLSPEEAETLWAQIQDDVQALVANHLALLNLAAEEAVSI